MRVNVGQSDSILMPLSCALKARLDGSYENRCSPHPPFGHPLPSERAANKQDYSPLAPAMGIGGEGDLHAVIFISCDAAQRTPLHPRCPADLWDMLSPRWGERERDPLGSLPANSAVIVAAHQMKRDRIYETKHLGTFQAGFLNRAQQQFVSFYFRFKTI
jgi:hypothetical protein